jgi:cytochrome P450
MQSRTTQLDPEVYPNPYFFYPSRWVTTDGGTPGMKERIMVFGKGSRACLGRSMAIMEIKIFLARIIDKYEVALADASTHDDMEMTDHFVLIPKGHKCQLVFTEVA